MRIRKIESRDDKEIKQIIQQTLSEFNDAKRGSAYFDPQLNYLAEYYASQSERAFYWVIEDERTNTILGGGGIGPFTDEVAELQKVYFLPESRGLGLGKKIIALAEEKAKEFGYKKLYIETFANLARAVRLYKYMGFNQLAKPLAQTEHNACDLWFEKKLTD
ncbi:acetyltransferase [Liquorilactobacillus aquaticus DSM 21051]|uniref:Acetyltransferase n=1 Tax=Liquorilactobacillus aquaticus DSM 21051 TaxID=1423725 RepID=A0A0R2CWT2_9LACO|nr:GNAT family N-acetyltransferase [Liquorilactobacillus aquaticus]KRM96317.1 acetyltransferase [Liquorilactobacillus aquaticus DSM 21051]